MRLQVLDLSSCSSITDGVWDSLRLATCLRTLHVTNCTRISEGPLLNFGRRLARFGAEVTWVNGTSGPVPPLAMHGRAKVPLVQRAQHSPPINHDSWHTAGDAVSEWFKWTSCPSDWLNRSGSEALTSAHCPLPLLQGPLWEPMQHYDVFCGVSPSKKMLLARARAEYAAFIRAEGAAATRIAAFYRMLLASRIYRKATATRRVAQWRGATLMQCCVRRHLARKLRRKRLRAVRFLSQHLAHRYRCRKFRHQWTLAVRHHNKSLFRDAMHGFEAWAVQRKEERGEDSMLRRMRRSIEYHRVSVLRSSLTALRHWLRRYASAGLLERRAMRLRRMHLRVRGFQSFVAVVRRHRQHRWRMAQARLNILPLSWRNAEPTAVKRRNAAADARGCRLLLQRSWRRWLAVVVLRRELMRAAHAHMLHRCKKRKTARVWFKVWAARSFAWKKKRLDFGRGAAHYHRHCRARVLARLRQHARAQHHRRHLQRVAARHSTQLCVGVAFRAWTAGVATQKRERRQRSIARKVLVMRMERKTWMTWLAFVHERKRMRCVAVLRTLLRIALLEPLAGT